MIQCIRSSSWTGYMLVNGQIMHSHKCDHVKFFTRTLSKNGRSLEPLHGIEFIEWKSLSNVIVISVRTIPWTLEEPIL